VAKVKWARSAALDVARELCDRLKPHCEKPEITFMEKAKP
jgi:hypothetical protein